MEAGRQGAPRFTRLIIGFLFRYQFYGLIIVLDE